MVLVARTLRVIYIVEIFHDTKALKKRKKNKKKKKIEF